MSIESKKSTTTKPKENQAKVAQPTMAPVQEGFDFGLSESQFAGYSGSMAGQTALLNRMHPPQRVAMAQRMTRTHSNAQLSRIFRQANAAQPEATPVADEPSLLQQTIAKYGFGDVFGSGAVGAGSQQAENYSSSPSSTTIHAPPTIQAKLTVNEADDSYEQEADQVADQVMRMPAPPADLPNDDEGSGNPEMPIVPVVQRAAVNDPIGGMEVNGNVESRVNNLDGGGQPLPDESRDFFESRMGADFSDVRIHNDAGSAELSRDLNARAFTVGNNIAFDSGEYNPGTPDGDRLLAHELTHTVQQGASTQLSRQIQREEEAEETAEPTPEEKAAALAAAAEAEAIAAAARSSGESATAQSQGAASSKQSEGEGDKAEAAASQAEGPVQQDARQQLEAQAIAGTEAKKSTSEAQQDAVRTEADSAKQVAIAQPAALEAQPQPLAPVEGGAAPSGAGLEGATAAAVAKMEEGYSAADNAPDKAPASAEEDTGYTASMGAAEAVGAEQQTHDPADGEADAAQAAAESPSAELTGQAQTSQVGTLENTETPEFDAAAFKQALMDKIASLAPQSPAEADDFKESGKVDAVKNDMSGQVEQERAQSEGPLDEASKAPPDMSSAEPKSVTPLDPVDAGPTPSEIGADKAVPKPKGAGEVEVPTAEGSAAVEQQMADANLTEEKLEASNEPEFTDALAQKREGEAQAQQSTQTYRQDEQTQISSAEADAVASAQSATQAMFATRTAALTQVEGDQQQTKSEDEKARDKIAADINGIYEKTKSSVENTLDNLDNEVNSTFEQGAEEANTAFENYVDAKMEAYKEERYGGFWGWAKWAKDKLTNSLPSEVNAFYAEGREIYIAKMDAVIDNIVAIIGTTLAKAKAEIANGKREIQEYVDQLPEDLKQVGQEAAQEIQGKFDELEQQVNDKQGELIDTLAQKYSENLQALDTKIQEMEEANRGIFAGIFDAIGGVIQKILELKRMLEDVLARAQAAVQMIIDDPIGFLGNLIDAVQQGFNQFVDNIGAHLGKGLMGWITGTLTEAGIQLPETFDLQGIFQLVMQVAGVSFDQIIGKLSGALGVDLKTFIDPVMKVIDIYNEHGFAGLAKYGLGQIIGEDNVESLMEVVEIVQMVISGNFEALWGLVKEHLSNLKEMLMDKIQDMVIKEVIEAGVKFVLSMFNPAGAFIKACMMIYDVVMFFVNHGEKIMALVNAVIDSVTNIANGDIGGAANAIENALASAIPVAIGFMASLLNLGDLPEKIRGIIKNIREAIDKAIDKILDLPPIKAILGFIKKLIAKAKDLIAKGIDKVKGALGMGEEQEEETKDPEALRAGLSAIDAEEQKYLSESGQIQQEEAQAITASVKAQHSIFNTLVVVDGGSTWDYEYTVQRASKKEGEPKDPNRETRYIKDGKLKEKYQGKGKIRARFYGANKGYGKDATQRKEELIAQNLDPNDSSVWIDPETGERSSANDVTIEHDPSVVSHWNEIGYNSDQQTRRNWFIFKDKLDKIKLQSRRRNSAGGGSMNGEYRKDVGPNFRGPDE